MTDEHIQRRNHHNPKWKIVKLKGSRWGPWPLTFGWAFDFGRYRLIRSRTGFFDYGIGDGMRCSNCHTTDVHLRPCGPTDQPEGGV